MLTVLRERPYQCYFYSHESNEPPHIHIDREGCSAKFWIKPITLAKNAGFRAKELIKKGKIGKYQVLFMAFIGQNLMRI